MEISTLIKWIRPLINDQEDKKGRDLFEYLGDNSFLLSEDFINASSIVVYHNHQEMDEEDWDFNSDNNRVTIDPVTSGEELATDDLVEVTYSFYNKYSDEEILGYIESAFLYFSEFRYKKVFRFDDEGTPTEVVVESGIGVNTREGHLIALVTAILILPNNQNINIKNSFSITSREQKSKKAQISETIARFERFLGTISFLEDCDEK